MERKQLLATIRAHLKCTGESPYAFGKRVMKDQAFIWKVEQGRQPRDKAVKKITQAIARRS